MAAAAQGGTPAAMAVMSSAAAASSTSDVPMPKKRKAAADTTGALRFAPQRFMKNIMPMMMSMMPVMMGQVTEMAARMLCTSASSEAAGQLVRGRRERVNKARAKGPGLRGAGNRARFFIHWPFYWSKKTPRWEVWCGPTEIAGGPIERW